MFILLFFGKLIVKSTPIVQTDLSVSFSGIGGHYKSLSTHINPFNRFYLEKKVTSTKGLRFSFRGWDVDLL